MSPHLKRKIRKLLSPFYRCFLKNKRVSIISNNCWGGVFYDKHALQYQSPTIGLYFFSKDYIKFVSNLEYYLSLDAIELNLNESKYYDILYSRHGNNVILGRVDDVEIVFLHYSSIDDALTKWNKRRKRVNFNNLIVKFNDQNLFSVNDFYEFSLLKYPKLFFTTNETLKSSFTCFVKKQSSNKCVVDDTNLGYHQTGVYKLINNIECYI